MKQTLVYDIFHYVICQIGINKRKQQKFFKFFRFLQSFGLVRPTVLELRPKAGRIEGGAKRGAPPTFAIETKSELFRKELQGIIHLTFLLFPKIIYNITWAGVAQRQSNGFVNHRSVVQIHPSAPLMKRKVSAEFSYRSSLKKEEAKVYRRITSLSFFFFIFLIIIIFFGIPFLNLVAGFWQFFRGPEASIETKNEIVLATKPKIEFLPTATNKDKIEIKGSTLSGVNIELIVNGTFVAKTLSLADGLFIFTGVNLKEGENKIEVIAFGGDNKASEPAKATVIFDKTAPKLEISQPGDKSSFPANTTDVAVAGKSEEDTVVTINEIQTVVSSDGSFSYIQPLKAGENQISVSSQDLAGNKTTKIISVFVAE